MRDLKFRVWDKQEKKMSPVANISFGDDGVAQTIMVESAPKAKHYHAIVHGENGILLQCTGLKDKAGKEIYEGDILRLVEHMPLSGIEIWEVFWNDGLWSLRNNEYEYNAIDWEDSNVIGNIWEHPELLRALQS